jgi:hypothetical protein
MVRGGEGRDYVMRVGKRYHLAGAAFLASVPPSGNRDLIFWWLRRDLGLSWRVTW